ncbi:hypothetical protein Dimus_031065 [Dionaea muscipula]
MGFMDYATMRTGIDQRRVLKFAVIFLAAGVACFALYKAKFISSSFDLHFLRFASFSSQGTREEMVRVFKGASMKNRTIILTMVNEAWARPNSTFDLMMESFRIGSNTSWLLKHLVVVALDPNSYSRCMELHPHCYFLTSPTTENNYTHKEAYFMTPRYFEMMWRRVDFLHTVLQLGYNFIFTDADIMWFRNPFHRFFEDADFQISCDRFNGNSLDLNNDPNNGFKYVVSNERTIKFYKLWYESRKKYPGLHEQHVLNRIKHKPFIKKIGLKMRFLDTLYFGGFCEPSKDFNQVCTMHANCCMGLDNKVHDLTLVLQAWQAFLSRPSSNQDMASKEPARWRTTKKCKL